MPKDAPPKDKFYDHTVVQISDIKPYAQNARLHSDHQVAQIARSIAEFGITNPILIDDKNNLIAGHGRLEAAKQMGLEEFPAIVVTGLTARRRKALVLADNKLAMNATWDLDMLSLELQSIGADLGEITGFSEQELMNILNEEFSPGDEGDQSDLDQLQPKMMTCPDCGHEWDTREQE